MGAIQGIFQNLWEWWLENVTGAIFDWLTEALIFMATSSEEFWQEEFVDVLLKISVVMSTISFAVAFVMMLFDAAETLAEEKPIFLSTMISDSIKALVFLNAAPYIGRAALFLLFDILRSLNWRDSLLENVESWVAGISSGFGIGFLIFIIGSIYFFWQSMKNSGLIFLHMMTCALYVPSIVRGDQTAMGGWLRQSAAILLTYFFQYLLFYMGVYLIFTGGIIVSLVPFITMFGVPRLLDKFGYSSGTGGMGSTVSSIIFQGASLVAKA